MANQQHLALLRKKGTTEWNKKRAENPEIVADLSGAKLFGADLNGVNLSGANLMKAHLTDANLSGGNLSGANLSGADLSDAHLSRADLTGAQLSFADLSRADLTGAHLTDADLSNAHLRGADLTGANLTAASLIYTNLTGARLRDSILSTADVFETVLADVDFTNTFGLDSCRHGGPSIVDHRTLLKSGSSLPVEFLRGCGLPDRLIDYLPSLMEAGPNQFYSCFISYSTANQDFANRLYSDLQSNGVRCWFAPHDILGGKRIHDQVDAAIKIYDRLLLILSQESMSSRWVGTEISKARQKELAVDRNVLFPITLVPFKDIRDWQQFDADIGDDSAKRIREYFVPDFSDWKNHDAYQPSFERLLKALKSQD